MSTLISSYRQLLSYPVGPSGDPTAGYTPPAAYMSSGTVKTGSSVSNAFDGTGSTYLTCNEITVAPAIDLQRVVAPDYMAAFFTNVAAPATVRAQGSNTSDFSVLLVDAAMQASGYHWWADLRAITGRAARYWRWKVTGNTAAVYVGEIVVGQVTTVRQYSWDYDDSEDYLERTLGATDLQVLVREKYNIRVRSRQVTFRGPYNVLADLFRRITIRQWRTDFPVVFIPDDTDTDIWLAEWDDDVTRKRILDQYDEVTITFEEQSPGQFPAV